MSIRDFEIVNQLGSGAFSKVFKVVRRLDQMNYALKQVALHTLDDKEKANCLNEVRILASVSHPNIIAYHEAFIDQASNSLCIVMELAEAGDLLQKINLQKRLGTRFPEAEIWKVFAEVVQGLNTLHEMHILHRDIKSANVFLTRDGQAKLGDMNVAKVAKQGLMNTQTGTPYYASPEVWKDQPYDFKSDIWSLGCVLYEMAALAPPFTAKDMNGLYQRVVKGQFNPLPETYSPDLAIMIKNLLQVNPISRPSSKRLVQMLVRGGYIETSPIPLRPNLLLNTIRFPKKSGHLAPIFPEPKYSDKKPVQHQIHNFSFEQDTHRIFSVRSVRSSSTNPRDRLVQRELFKGQDGHLDINRVPPGLRLPQIRHK